MKLLVLFVIRVFTKFKFFRRRKKVHKMLRFCFRVYYYRQELINENLNICMVKENYKILFNIFHKKKNVIFFLCNNNNNNVTLF